MMMVLLIIVNILRCQIVDWYRIINRIIINLNYIQPIRVEGIERINHQLVGNRNRRELIDYLMWLMKNRVI